MNYFRSKLPWSFHIYLWYIHMHTNFLQCKRGLIAAACTMPASGTSPRPASSSILAQRQNVRFVSFGGRRWGINHSRPELAWSALAILQLHLLLLCRLLLPVLLPRLQLQLLLLLAAFRWLIINLRLLPAVVFVFVFVFVLELELDLDRSCCRLTWRPDSFIMNGLCVCQDIRRTSSKCAPSVPHFSAWLPPLTGCCKWRRRRWRWSSSPA